MEIQALYQNQLNQQNQVELNLKRSEENIHKLITNEQIKSLQEKKKIYEKIPQQSRSTSTSTTNTTNTTERQQAKDAKQKLQERLNK